MSWRFAKFSAKAWAFGAAMLAAFVSAQFQPVKDFLLQPCYVRWHLADDRKLRSTTITITNDLPNRAQLTLIQEGLSDGALADLRHKNWELGPEVSLVKTACRAVPQASMLSGRTYFRLRRLKDEHYPSASLEDLQAVFDDELSAVSGNPSKRVPAAVLDRHQVLVRQCSYPLSRKCRNEDAVQNWEQALLTIWGQADAAWEAHTGMSLNFENGPFSHHGTLYAKQDLQPGTSQFITFRYGAEGLQPKLSIRGEGTEVAKEDLHSSAWFVALKYHTGYLTLTLLPVVIVVWFGFIIRQHKPLEDRQRYELTSLALDSGSDGEDIWNALYDKLRPSLVAELIRLSEELRKPAPSMGAAELFGHLRNFLLIDDRHFQTDIELDARIRTYLREIILHS